MTQYACALLVGMSLVASGCTSAPPPEGLASDQVLRLSASQEVVTLDPAKSHQPTVEGSLVRNVFSGLYRINDDLTVVPDIATGMPDVSADGLTWTFALRQDARFSNGKPVTSADVLYSWNRLAALPLDAYPGATILYEVAGFSEVQSGRSKTLAGLVSRGDHTVVATLTTPAGWWLAELGLWSAALVDQKVVESKGEDTWWSTPDGLIGTGPFRMSKRDPGRSLDFEPVANWWAGPTGHLKRVHVDVIADPAAQIASYDAGDIDIVGYLPHSLIADVSDGTITRFQNDSQLRRQLFTRPWMRTGQLGFPRLSRFGSAGDVAGRRALSLALDRGRLAANCFAGGVCVPATGGLLYRGVAGYLGDGADPNATYDVASARALLSSWDPTGRRRDHLRLGAPSLYSSLAAEVKAEWQSALGLTVDLELLADYGTFRRNADAGRYDVAVTGYLADYNSPANWFHNIGRWCQAAFLNPQFTALVAAGDRKLPTAAVDDYKRAGQVLAADAACPELVYQQGVYLIKPWVKGAGGNAFYEKYWTDISILAH